MERHIAHALASAIKARDEAAEALLAANGSIVEHAEAYVQEQVLIDRLIHHDEDRLLHGSPGPAFPPIRSR